MASVEVARKTVAGLMRGLVATIAGASRARARSWTASPRSAWRRTQWSMSCEPEAERLDRAEGLLVFRAGEGRPVIALRADDTRCIETRSLAPRT